MRAGLMNSPASGRLGRWCGSRWWWVPPLITAQHPGQPIAIGAGHINLISPASRERVVRRPSPSLSSFLSHPRRTAPASSPIVILALKEIIYILWYIRSGDYYREQTHVVAAGFLTSTARAPSETKSGRSGAREEAVACIIMTSALFRPVR
jgi:hypothetical protein